MIKLVIRTVLAALGLTVIQGLVAAVLPLSEKTTEPIRFGLILLSNALTASVLLLVARQLRVTGWRRVVILFALSFGISGNSLLETVFFPLDIPRSALATLFGNSLGVSLLFALLVDLLAGASAGSEEGVWPTDRSAGAWALRVAACDLLYFPIYLGAGMLVWPFVEWFYSRGPMPSLGLLVQVQLLRGLIFVAVLAVPLSKLAKRPVPAAILIGATLSILGGVAPLLMPNPYMPEAVRMAHLVETGTSNFLFAWLVARILTAAGKQEVREASAAVPG